MAAQQPARRVAITGYGAICPGAVTGEQFWDAMVGGRSYLSSLDDQFDTSGFRVRIGGICREYIPDDHFSERDQSKLCRTSQFAVVAAREAKAKAGLGTGAFDNGHVGVFMGTGFGGQQVIEEYVEGAYCNKPELKNTLAIPLGMSNAPSSNMAITFKATGPNLTVCTACSSGANAVGAAFAAIRDGKADAMMTGGVEAPITWGVMQAWSGLRVLSRSNDAPHNACKPFSKNREGFVLTEGCGVLVLEELEAAVARGAPIVAEIVGYASSADAHHITSPAVDGLVRAIEGCLADAGLTPDDVDYINAHGTATKPNDAAETAAIKQVFGDRARCLPISSIKSMLGHSMGAAGGLEAIATALTLATGMAPPTINYEQFDDDCDLDYVTEGARPGAYRVALSNSFGFGGNNAVLALKRWDG